MNPTRKYNRRRKDPRLYRLRGKVENFFHDIKRFRAVASRYEKTARNFLAVVHIACIFQWLNQGPPESPLRSRTRRDGCGGVSAVPEVMTELRPRRE